MSDPTKDLLDLLERIGHPALAEVLRELDRSLSNPPAPETREAREARVRAVAERVLLKADAMARAAVGREFRVEVRKATRTQSGRTIFGTIARCEVAGVRVRAGSVVARWRVWIGNHEPVVVEALPR